ncbi:MAG: type I phosphoribosyltransferase, partial [Candidatus Xenobia bacterium]
STAEVVKVLQAHGTRILGLTCLVDRSGGKAADLLKLPVYPLIEMEVPTWSAEACPMCAQGQPLVKPGSRP